MQTDEFSVFIDKFPCLKKHFLGVFALNQIPKSMLHRSFLIFNKDPDYLNGSHWIALVRLDGSDYQIFDSLGCDFDFVKKFLKFKNAKFTFNTQAFQSTESNTCGLFCLYWIVHRMMSVDLSFNELLLEIFEINTTENEKKVIDFWHNF